MNGDVARPGNGRTVFEPERHARGRARGRDRGIEQDAQKSARVGHPTGRSSSRTCGSSLVSRSAISGLFCRSSANENPLIS